ncbi:larval cuticle protein 65Ag1 [Drosophila ficusphila]|uniref:larval cuticle protein 65Ag1 n=1 Tax=Drosophila ficusphila TaxID=30025 RepID=UPI0007E6200B|nr:larval cuticle protein 65Ag1 [Drosophila ficusphila]
MKTILVFACLSMALCLAAPAQEAEIVEQKSEVNADSYNYSFETSDGTKQEQHGTVKNLGPEEEALQVAGSYSYVGDDGQTYSITYVADENGFQPQGEHIPHL